MTKLKQLRITAGLSQIEVSEIIGISVRQYQRYEIATIKGCTAIWQKLAKLFNVTIDYLLQQADNTTNPEVV